MLSDAIKEYRSLVETTTMKDHQASFLFYLRKFIQPKLKMMLEDYETCKKLVSDKVLNLTDILDKRQINCNEVVISLFKNNDYEIVLYTEHSELMIFDYKDGVILPRKEFTDEVNDEMNQVLYTFNEKNIDAYDYTGYVLYDLVIMLSNDIESRYEVWKELVKQQIESNPNIVCRKLIYETYKDIVEQINLKKSEQ